MVLVGDDLRMFEMVGEYSVVDCGRKFRYV